MSDPRSLLMLFKVTCGLYRTKRDENFNQSKRYRDLFEAF